jgi:hypothetical protein
MRPGLNALGGAAHRRRDEPGREEIHCVVNRMHDGQPLAGKIRSAWEGIRDQRPEAGEKPARSSYAARIS